MGSATREQLNKVDAQRRAVDQLKQKDEAMAVMIVEKDRCADAHPARPGWPSPPRFPYTTRPSQLH